MKLPAGKIIVPAVVETSTDLVKHRARLAERRLNCAKLVDMEKAGTDCGIGSRGGHESIAWIKLKAMADGAAIAAKRLERPSTSR